LVPVPEAVSPGVNPTRIDHLVVTAPTLEIGAQYVHRVLGFRPEPGGEHARMGTHNRLLRIGASTYLEVIAVNPDAARPNHPRWFELDTLLPDAPPRLATWVLRTTDIHALSTSAPIPIGPVLSMSRGDLRWLIAFPEDGSLILSGFFPYVIQWVSDEHPASRLPETGLELLSLEVRDPEPDRIARSLSALGWQDRVNVTRGQPSRLIARIATPWGERQLSGIPGELTVE
jgi:glyoxalase-like protein